MKIDQDILRKNMLDISAISSIDDRGYYIVASGINGGIHYLYDDGIIRVGVNATGTKAKSFWTTEGKATEFFSKWKES